MGTSNCMEDKLHGDWTVLYNKEVCNLYRVSKFCYGSVKYGGYL